MQQWHLLFFHPQPGFAKSKPETIRCKKQKQNEEKNLNFLKDCAYHGGLSTKDKSAEL